MEYLESVFAMMGEPPQNFGQGVRWGSIESTLGVISRTTTSGS